jgi:hypothetical protein
MKLTSIITQRSSISYVTPSALGLIIDFLCCKLLRKPSRLLQPIPDGLRLHVGD